MDSNRDEAIRCLEIAEKATFVEFNYDKAKKFLQKAEKLFPTQRAKGLLGEVTRLSKASKKHLADEEPIRNRKEQPSKETHTSTAAYSKKDLDAIQRIKKCKDYYEILGVNKDSTDSDIKKSYKKLALQLHPDKNNAPGAAEAFKTIGNAVATLTDGEKRKQYNMYIIEEAKRKLNSQQGNGQSVYNHSREFESDLTADEMFNMFFGGGIASRRGRRWSRQPDSTDRQSGYTSFIQMLPIILLIMISMMSSFFIPDPIYSLNPSQKFLVQRKTENLKVPYYVKENFHLESRGSNKRMEVLVEEEYINNMRHNCNREKNYKESIAWKAQYFGDEALYLKSQSMTTPSCDILNNLNTAHYYIPT